MKKAVITSGAKQYLVAEGDTIEIELLKAEGKSTSFVPLLVIDGDKTTIGTPEVTGTKVTAEIIEADVKADKVTAIRYKAKKASAQTPGPSPTPYRDQGYKDSLNDTQAPTIPGVFYFVLFYGVNKGILLINTTTMRRIMYWNIKKLSCLLALSLLVTVSLFYGVAEAITRGYTTDDTGLQTGMVASLSLESDDSNKIERASNNSSKQVVGVVTTIDSSLLTIGSGNAKVFVESEGEVEAYVSDINGVVNKGDLLVSSPLKGVLMKADDNSASLIGIAAADLKSVETTSYEYKDENKNKTAQIARIRVNLNRQGADSTGPKRVDSSIAKFGKALVGKDVGEIRVIIAMVVFVVVLVAEGGIIYGAISSAITAIGRNPLAKDIISGEFIKVIMIAIVVLGLGLGAIYGILWI